MPAIPQQRVRAHVEVGGKFEFLGEIGVVWDLKVGGNQADTVLGRKDIILYISIYIYLVDIMTYIFWVLP